MNDNINTLEKIKANDGKEKCKAYLYHTFSRNRNEAIELINDNNLSFPTYYLLLPMISALKIYADLNDNKKLTINIINQIIIPETYYRGKDYLSQKSDEVYKILLWMVETGYLEDDEGEEYEQIIDIVVGALIKIYEEKSILAKVADLIFKRNKKDKFINDLAWAYFSSKDIDAVKIIANRLLSEDNNEVNLAKKLLNLKDNITDKNAFFNEYSEWLKENDNFLYFTEECNQFITDPTPIRTDLARKYLNKGVKTYQKEPLIPENQNENQCLAVFSQLDVEDKALLSKYSNILNRKNKDSWKKWILLPVDEQLIEAKKEMGEDYYL